VLFNWRGRDEVDEAEDAFEMFHQPNSNHWHGLRARASLGWPCISALWSHLPNPVLQAFSAFFSDFAPNTRFNSYYICLHEIKICWLISKWQHCQPVGMMSSSRHVFFNPTSIPGLRTKQIQTREFYNGGTLKRIGLGKDVRYTRWGGLRKQGTETGENQTGHITAKANEGILFFDSMRRHSIIYQNLMRY
jgi:hypothetical protein